MLTSKGTIRSYRPRISRTGAWGPTRCALDRGVRRNLHRSREPTALPTIRFWPWISRWTPFVRELAITGEPREVCVGCCVYDAATAEADLEPHGLHPGVLFEDARSRRNRLADLSNCDFSTGDGPSLLNGHEDRVMRNSPE
jgi:hypothetical protein